MMPLYKRLSHYAHLTDDDFGPINGLSAQRLTPERGRDIIVAGEPCKRAFVVKRGWAIRYQMLEDGRRQVLDVLMPGDIFDLQVFIATEADHSVMAVTDMELSAFAPMEVLSVLSGHSVLALAFWWATVQEEAILRQQIVRNGRRTARERVAHFLLELHRRALVVAEGDDNGFDLPLTQSIIGDALGLSHIHINRVLRKFTQENLIKRDRSWLQLIDRDRLVEISEFDPSYLHLESAQRMRLKASVLEAQI